MRTRIRLSLLALLVAAGGLVAACSEPSPVEPGSAPLFSSDTTKTDSTSTDTTFTTTDDGGGTIGSGN